jgi:hypothetical protein
MKRALFLFSVSALAQSVGSPTLGYVIDADSRLLPILGVPGSARLGESLGAAAAADGSTVLRTNGEAYRGAQRIEGQWAFLENGVLLDAARRQGFARGRRYSFGSEVAKAAASESRVLTLLANENLVAWDATGNAEFSVPASIWWSIALSPAGEIFAFDAAAKSLLRFDAQGRESVVAAFEDGIRIDALAVNATHAVMADLEHGKVYIVDIAAKSTRALKAPDNTDTVKPSESGGVFLLSSDPSQPLWLLDPSLKNPLLVVPAKVEGGRQ